MPSTNPADYPIAQPLVGSQYVMYNSPTNTHQDITDYTAAGTDIQQFFAANTGLAIDITKLSTDYYSVVTPIKFNGASKVEGEQQTNLTATGMAYIAAKTTNNYSTGDLENGILLYTAVAPSTITITRAGTTITNLSFEIKTAPVTTFAVAIPAGTTIAQAKVLINEAAPEVLGRPAVNVRSWVGDESTVFNLLPTDSMSIESKDKIILLETHVLTPAEKAQYPAKMTIVYPSLHGNPPAWSNILLYNAQHPELSFQYYGVRTKSFNMSLANNGITGFSYSQMAIGAVSRPNLVNIQKPAFIDDYTKVYTQATYNTACYWDGVYAGQITDMTVNIEYDIPDGLNITGIRFPYPNGKVQVGLSGGSILNETSYKQFYTDMVDNLTPSLVTESAQLIAGVAYQMLIINNNVNGKPTTVKLNTGALEFSFPSEAIGQSAQDSATSNLFVFLHDDIPNFVTNLN